MAIGVGCFSVTKRAVLWGFPCDQPGGTSPVAGGERNALLTSVETQGRRFSEIDGWTRLGTADGHTSGNSVFSNRFAFLGSNRFSQSTTLATGLGNGVSPSAFNHCRRQLSGSSHFVPRPSSCHRPPNGISAAKRSDS